MEEQFKKLKEIIGLTLGILGGISGIYLAIDKIEEFDISKLIIILGSIGIFYLIYVQRAKKIEAGKRSYSFPSKVRTLSLVLIILLSVVIILILIFQRSKSNPPNNDCKIRKHAIVISKFKGDINDRFTESLFAYLEEELEEDLFSFREENPISMRVDHLELKNKFMETCDTVGLFMNGTIDKDEDIFIARIDFINLNLVAILGKKLVRLTNPKRISFNTKDDAKGMADFLVSMMKVMDENCDDALEKFEKLEKQFQLSNKILGYIALMRGHCDALSGNIGSAISNYDKAGSLNPDLSKISSQNIEKLEEANRSITITPSEVTGNRIMRDTFVVKEDSSINLDILFIPEDNSDNELLLSTISFSSRLPDGIEKIVDTIQGTITVKLEADFNGFINSLFYTIQDKFNTTYKGNIYFRVKPDNDPPIAKNDTLLVTARNRIINLLKNDWDVDNDLKSLSFRLLNNFMPSKHGSIEVVNNNRIVYKTKKKDLKAKIAPFQYEICDEEKCDTAYVFLTINLSRDRKNMSKKNKNTKKKLFDGTVKGPDGQIYKTKKFGKIRWTVDDLRTQKKGAFKHGKNTFYTYYAAKEGCSELKGDGWRLPYKGEWKKLSNMFEDGYKSLVDSIVFVSKAKGYSFHKGSTYSAKNGAYFWTNSSRNKKEAYFFYFHFIDKITSDYHDDKNIGFSVRCVTTK